MPTHGPTPSPYEQNHWIDQPEVHPTETPVDTDRSVYVTSGTAPPQPSPSTRPLSVDTTETGHVITSNDASVIWRHRSWQTTRSRVRIALEELRLRPKLLKRFDLCGSNPWVMRDAHDNEHYSIAVNTCRHRFCLPCQRSRARIIRNNLAELLDDEPCRMITLTLAHTQQPLKDQVNHLYASYRRLRQRKIWKQHVRAALAMLECTYNAETDTWHPHLHVLCHGTYIYHRHLKEAWHDATKTSYIVHVTLVRSREKAANYVTDYLTKPMKGLSRMPIARLCELISAYKGTRTALPTGEWAHANLLKPLDSDTEWLPLAPLDVYFDRARDGDSDALKLLADLGKTIPHVNELCDRSPPPT